MLNKRVRRCKIPCYQVNVYDVEFKAKNKNLFLKALETLGWQIQGELTENLHGIAVTVIDSNGQPLTLGGGMARGSAASINELRNAYSDQAIASAKQWAKINNMKVSQTSPNKVNIKMGW